MQLYFTRHERTPWNEGKRNGAIVDGTPIVQSWSDCPDTQITEEGRHAAKKKGAVLRNEPIEIVIHTGMGRTMETAERIAEGMGHNVLMYEDLGMRDRSYGFWDGYTLSELEHGPHATTFSAWKRAKQDGDETFTLPHSPELFRTQSEYEQATPPDSVSQVRNRMKLAMPKYIAVEEPTLFVGHQDSTRLGIALLLADQFHYDNTRLNSITNFLSIPNEMIIRMDTQRKAIETYDYKQGAWAELQIPGK